MLPEGVNEWSGKAVPLVLSLLSSLLLAWSGSGTTLSRIEMRWSTFIRNISGGERKRFISYLLSGAPQKVKYLCTSFCSFSQSSFVMPKPFFRKDVLENDICNCINMYVLTCFYPKEKCGSIQRENYFVWFYFWSNIIYCGQLFPQSLWERVIFQTTTPEITNWWK